MWRLGYGADFTMNWQYDRCPYFKDSIFESMKNEALRKWRDIKKLRSKENVKSAKGKDNAYKQQRGMLQLRRNIKPKLNQPDYSPTNSPLYEFFFLKVFGSF